MSSGGDFKLFIELLKLSFFDVFSYQSNQVSQIRKRESNKNNYWHVLQMTDTPYSVPCALQHGFLQILDTFLPLFLSGQRSHKRIRKRRAISF